MLEENLNVRISAQYEAQGEEDNEDDEIPQQLVILYQCVSHNTATEPHPKNSN